MIRIVLWFLSKDSYLILFFCAYQEEGVNITANSLHPGLIATNLFTSNGGATNCKFLSPAMLLSVLAFNMTLFFQFKPCLVIACPLSTNVLISFTTAGIMNKIAVHVLKNIEQVCSFCSINNTILLYNLVHKCWHSCWF